MLRRNRLFLQEPHGVISQKTPFFIVTAVKTSQQYCRRAGMSVLLCVGYTDRAIIDGQLRMRQTMNWKESGRERHGLIVGLPR
jgi:hypothetical protein